MYQRQRAKNQVRRNGRAAALEAIDCLMAKDANIRTFARTMQDAFDLAPLQFFLDFVKPFIAKEMLTSPQVLAAAEIDMYLAEVKGYLGARLKRHPRLLKMLITDLQGLSPAVGSPAMTDLTPDAMVRDLDSCTAPNE